MPSKLPDLRTVTTDAAPPPAGPYSQAVELTDTVVCSTQLPRGPGSGRVADDVRHQALQCLDNLDAVCRAAGTDLGRAVQVRFYFVDRADLPAINEAFAEWFGDWRPARAPVHVVSLAAGASISIEAVVAK